MGTLRRIIVRVAQFAGLFLALEATSGLLTNIIIGVALVWTVRQLTGNPQPSGEVGGSSRQRFTTSR